MLRRTITSIKPASSYRQLFPLQTYAGALKFSTQQNVPHTQEYGNEHFRTTSTKHPLIPNKKATFSDTDYGDHTGRLQNYIWKDEEIAYLKKNMYRHIPKSFSDHLMNKIMYSLYHTFNFITGYNPENPTVKAIEWRLIVLESVAGVPGFLAAAVRHFHSLRYIFAISIISSIN